MPEKKADKIDTPPRSRADKLTTVLMGGAALCAVAGFGVLFSMWWRTGISDKYEILRIASQQYVSGNPIVAGDLAEKVEFEQQNENDLPAEDAAEPPLPDSELSPSELVKRNAERQAKEKLQEWIRLRNFLIGAGKVARAKNESDSRDRRGILREAIPYLQASGKAEFPPGRQTEGDQILGESLFELGRYEDAIIAMRRALEQDPTLRRTLSSRLAEAELYSAKSTPDRALTTIEKFLGDRTLQPPQIWIGQRIRIRALIDLQRWDEANEAIALARQQASQANTEDPAVKMGQSQFYDQLKLLEAIGQIQKTSERLRLLGDQQGMTHLPKSSALDATIYRLNDLQRHTTPQISSQARLWAARANLIAGHHDDALTLLTAVRSQRPLGPEAIISGLEEIELLAKQGRGEEVLQTTRYLIREIGDQQGFQASEVSFNEFRRRLTDSLDQLRRHAEFEYAIDIARALPPVFDSSEALIQEAIGYQTWAAATIIDGTNLSDQASRGAARLARSRYRAAGDAYAQAAKIRFDTEEYLPTQWSAIEAYQNGRHFSRSIVLLDEYLRYERRRRQPRGLVAYGRALLAEGNADEAIEALTTCIDEFPRDPLRYDARLLAALAHSEKGDLEKSRELLTANLQDGDLAPQSPAFRDSLFTLAELLYQRGYRNYIEAERVGGPERLSLLRSNQPTLEEAVKYLDQAVDRYKWIPRAESAAYMSARAHILASHWPRLESESPEILDSARRTLRTDADAQLQIALDGFTQLRQHLLSREDERGLPAREQRLLRNCYVAGADVLREMDRLEEAATAYKAIELRYMNEPTALEAIVGRASCMRDLGRPEEADMLIKLANVVLNRIPKEWDDRFDETTRYDRSGWQELLGWMNNRINDGV